MKLKAPLTLVLAGALATSLACGGGKPGAQATPSPDSKDLGQAMADTTNDTQVLREASAAANEVIRSAADCEMVRPILQEARDKIEAAAPRLKTAAGFQTLDALRRQVQRVADACPG